ncbi:MAG: hypothetical protein ABIJ16_09605 [Bacteroidota bacterium]
MKKGLMIYEGQEKGVYKIVFYGHMVPPYQIKITDQSGCLIKEGISYGKEYGFDLRGNLPGIYQISVGCRDNTYCDILEFQ